MKKEMKHEIKLMEAMAMIIVEEFL